MVRRYAAAALIASALLFAPKADAAMTPALQDFLDEHSTVKIYVELKNSSGDNKVDTDVLQGLLGRAFVARASHAFVIAPSPTDADMILKCDIIEYVWLENDPIDQVWGIGAAAMDAAMSENYARIEADAQLVAAKKGKVLWSCRVQATMTQKLMPRDASYELVDTKFVRTLLIEIFKKHSA